jgi:Cysteine-rich secretory protein family
MTERGPNQAKSGGLFLIEISARRRRRQKSLVLWLAAAIAALFAAAPSTARAGTPAELISSFRHQHGEGKVTIDPLLNRIAQEQARAMAARDVLDHDALKPFSARVITLGPRRAAENIAYGYDTFPKTLDQWTGSFGHRSNLLMHDASRVGIASAKSPKTGRTYWAMVIAAPEPKRIARAKGANAKEKPCRFMLNDLCL